MNYRVVQSEMWQATAVRSSARGVRALLRQSAALARRSVGPEPDKFSAQLLRRRGPDRFASPTATLNKR